MPTKTKAAKFLHERSGHWIVKQGSRVHLELFEPWSSEHAKRVNDFGVESIQLNPAAVSKESNLDVLLEFPTLKHVHIVLGKPIDLSALTKLKKLESLGLMGAIVSVKDGSSPAIDLSSLTQLRKAYILFVPPVAVDSAMHVYGGSVALEWP